MVLTFLWNKNKVETFPEKELIQSQAAPPAALVGFS